LCRVIYSVERFNEDNNAKVKPLPIVVHVVMYGIETGHLAWRSPLQGFGTRLRERHASKNGNPLALVEVSAVRLPHSGICGINTTWIH
jgi:hypothetical protein